MLKEAKVRIFIALRISYALLCNVDACHEEALFG
jgi:hypothetical protein